MSAARHWSDFPPALFELVAKLDSDGPLVMENVSKADAYNIRNEYHRFRRAIARAFHADADDNDKTIQELHRVTCNATLQVAPTPNGVYRLTLGKPAISASLDKWKALER